MKKSVRFSDLSFIQESEEGEHGEVTLEVPNFPSTSATPAGVPSSQPPQLQAGVGADAPKPASCPFGDRVTKKQQGEEGEVQSKADAPRKEDDEIKFPRNIILIQEQEKAKAAKKKKTGGVNPLAGKERGSSFIIARNYLYSVTDNSDRFLPRGLSSQHIDFNEATADSNKISTEQVVAQADDNLASDAAAYSHNVEVEKSASALNSDVNRTTSVSSNVELSQNSYCQQLSSLVLQNPTTSISTAPPYSLSPVLTSTVNPFIAPSNQLDGSAAYDLKPLPHDNLSKIDVVTSSKINQYLHTSRDQSPAIISNQGITGQIPTRTYPYLTGVSNHQERNWEATCGSNTLQGQQLNSSSDGVIFTDVKLNGLSLQFLKDNFAPPVPISNDKLFHVLPSTIDTSNIVDTAVLPQPTVSQSQRQNEAQISRPQSSSPPPVIGPVVVSPRKQAFPNQTPSPTPGARSAPSVTSGPTPPTTTAMSLVRCTHGTQEVYSGVTSVSRVQEKEELQRLHERFTTYVSRVRQLGQEFNSVDTSAFLRSTKILEDEIVTLKNMYEKELEALRKEIEYNAGERNSLHSQFNKQQKSTGELQDRLSIETEKNSKLLDEINVLQRKIGNLEAEILDIRVTSQRPREETEQMQRAIENFTREVEQWKHRYEHENLARQEVEDKFQQLRKKVEFSDQVHAQQVTDYQSRLDTSSAAILSLEAKVRELSTADITVADMLKQVRDTAETELRKFQLESEQQYSRNLTALKAQIDHDADALQRIQTEKSELMGNIGELQAKIRNLEGQVANMQHQKQTLEEAVTLERTRAADNVQQLEVKLRNVQDLLVTKMREVTNAREANIPLKAEIETLKALIEEEERRLRIPLGIVPASIVQTSITPTPSTSQILASSISNQVLKPPSPNNALRAMTGQSVGVLNKTTISDQACTPAGLPQSSAATIVSQPLPPLTRVVNPTSVTFSAATSAPLPPSETAKSTMLAADTSNSTTVINANYNYQPMSMSNTSFTNPLYPYVPSPPLETQYIPEALQTVDDVGIYGYDPEYGSGVHDYELYQQGISFPMSGPRYLYEATPSINRLHVEPSPPISPHLTGCSPVRAKSAPVAQDREAQNSEKAKQQKNIDLVPTSLGNGQDYFDEMFKDLQKETVLSKPRPKSSPLERPLPSTFHDYTVSTSSAIGDLKILEVNQDGKFVRLHNDGPCEVEFGGYMIQQNVGGHPVAVFRFPPRTKFPPDSTITVWAAMNDPLLHNPPTDFFWKEQQKWGTGPECTTILCRANGQAVAWTTAAHRFTKDAFQEMATDNDDEGKYNYSKRDETTDEEGLTELNIDATGPKPEPVYLRREKQQPPSLVAPKHPHGSSPCTTIHPHTGQPRPLRHGNDNSSVNRQSRTQSTRPDPIPGQPYAGAPAQRLGSAPLRKIGNSGSQPTTIRSNGAIANKSAGSIRMPPSKPLLTASEVQALSETQERAQQLIRFSS